MKCEQCNVHLSALVDDELADEIREQVQSHLADCPRCQQSLADLRLVDHSLAKLTLPASAIDQTLLALQRRSPLVETGATERSWMRRTLPFAIAALAASIAWALIGINRPDRPLDPDRVPGVIATLVNATGEMEVLHPTESQWKSVAANGDVGLLRGSRIRTGEGVVCEVQTTQGSKIRLDQSSELVLLQPDHMQLVQGRVWSRVSPRQPIRLDALSLTDNPPRLLSMQCPSDSEFQWSTDQNEFVCDSLSDAQTEWTNQTFQWPVSPGERVAVQSNLDVVRTVHDPTTAKLWQLPLLAVDRNDIELEKILEPMLVRIGSTKAGLMQADQIRQLGPAGAIPLLAYVQNERSKAHSSARQNAMQIASETADRSSLDRLIQLTGDEDPVVSQIAKLAVRRLQSESP